MNMEQLLAELGHLDSDALEQLKAAIIQREHELQAKQHPRTPEEVDAALHQFIDDFWEDTPAEEQKEILDAIRFKNYNTHKDV